MKQLTATQLQELLAYDPNTGVFTWRVNRTKVRAGDTAGTINGPGYCCITIFRRMYLAHRLAWLYMHGTWPSGQIDHRNGVRTDNRVENLRNVLPAANAQNQRHPQGDNPFLGVSWVSKGSRWIARIRIDGKQRYLGCFTTAEAARDAYTTAKRVHHAGCTI